MHSGKLNHKDEEGKQMIWRKEDQAKKFEVWTPRFESIRGE
jgi:hypothetical protein